MAELPKLFQADETGGFDLEGAELLPDGEYPATVEKTSKKTSQGGNYYLSIRFSVESGDSTVSIFDNFNLWHPTPSVRKISEQRLQQLIYACGLPDAENSDELEGCSISVVVGTQKPKGDFPAKNTIKKFVKP